MARLVGRSLVRRVHLDCEAARQRGKDLASLHPWPDVARRDPVTEDQIYPCSPPQAAAQLRMSPALWERFLRDGWRQEIEAARRRAGHRKG